MGDIKLINENVRFLRTFHYLPEENTTDFIGVHMSGTKMAQKQEIWTKYFT